jgi:cation/acetate symporter
MMDVFAITFALMAGTAGLPHVIVRFFTVPKVKDARISAGWALIFIAILYTTAPAISAFARTNLIRATSNIPYTQVPEWFSNWEKTGLIKFEDKNSDGVIQYLAQPDLNELTIDNDIIVLANPEIAHLPNWVIALVAAGGLAAALSTAAGLLLVISTSIAHDLIKKQLNSKISEKKELFLARFAAGVAVLVAGYFGVNPPGFVAATVALAFGLAASSFFPAIVLGIFDKRMNKQGAIAGMVTGISLMLFYMIYFKLGWFTQTIPPSTDWWWDISPEGFGTVGMLINIVVALVVSRLTTPPPVHIQQLTESIRYPRRTA